MNQSPTAKQEEQKIDEKEIKGTFKRVESSFRNFITEQGQFQPEPHRYRLYVSYACPWANRTLIVRNLKQLQDIIDVSVVHPTFQKTKPNDTHIGWVFRKPTDAPLQNLNGFGSFDCEGCIPDPEGCNTLREIYEKSNDTLGKYSVPILYDTKTKVIVNNESSEIIIMLNNMFNKYSGNPELDLCPPELEEKMKEVDSWIYNNINNGVYKCGFAQSQDAYDYAFQNLFIYLDKLEQLLSEQRFVAGNRLTLSDIRTFVTLVRFDEVYVVYFKCNKKQIIEYPNILNYCREIYQMKGVKETINMKHIKTHYFSSHPQLNYYGIIPGGNNFLVVLEQPHDRARFDQ